LGFADNRWGQQVTRRRSDDVDTRIDIEPRTFHPESIEPAFAVVNAYQISYSQNSNS
jgi:hypothetical protein